MIGYKAFSKDLMCKGFRFKENETFEIKGPLKMCENGFHFCDVPINVLNYYNSPTDKYAIIEALGEIQFKDDKLVTDKIKIVKVINRLELESECGNNSYYTKSGEYHFKNGLLHRDNDLPARIYINGDLVWYFYGQLHRDNDLPARINYNGDQFWYQNGLLHRLDDKPAVINISGRQQWYQNGRLFRENDKPVQIISTGDQFWFKNRVLHRDNNLPAIITHDNYKIYFINGHVYDTYK